jgi:ATP-dependent protease ClpP protease subunit
MEILKIENKAGKAKLTDAIFKESTDKLLEEIGSVFGASAMAEGKDFGVLMNCAENAADTMEVEIHSPGGSILDGYRIYQAITDLRARGVHVTAIINTLAASMASVIAMAADKVKIVKGGRMMIHEASTATWGNAEDHARSAKLLDEMSDEIAGIYAERTGKPQKEMRDRMRKETWMSAETAVSEGFADEVVSGRNEYSRPSYLTRQRRSSRRAGVAQERGSSPRR